MIGVIILLAGMGIGAMLTVAVQATWRTIVEQDRRLPAATPRAIARVRRRNRADLRHVRPAIEVGVRVAHRRRPETLDEPPSFNHEEHTR